MQFNVALLAAAVLVSASPVMSATITWFAGAGCTGQVVFKNTIGSNTCLTAGSASARSISWSGVPSRISLFESGGGHDSCTNGAQATFGGGSGCSTAPDGFNWESVLVN